MAPPAATGAVVPGATADGSGITVEVQIGLSVGAFGLASIVTATVIRFVFLLPVQPLVQSTSRQVT